MLSFELHVLVEQDFILHLMQLMEDITIKLEDLAETKKVLKAWVKLDGYH